MRSHSTREAAGLVGVDLATLHRWLKAGKVRPSIAVPMDGRTLWRWTDADVRKVRKFKDANYCKGRGRKPRKGR